MLTVKPIDLVVHLPNALGLLHEIAVNEPLQLPFVSATLCAAEFGQLTCIPKDYRDQPTTVADSNNTQGLVEFGRLIPAAWDEWLHANREATRGRSPVLGCPFAAP